MKLRQSLAYCAVAALKALAAAALGIIGFSVGGLVTGSLGIVAPVLPARIDAALILALYAGIWFVSSIVVGETFKRLNQGFPERFLCVFLMNYVVQHFSQALEQIIFTSTASLAYSAVFNLFPSLFFSFATALLWKPRQANRSILKELPSFFARRGAKDWAIRLSAASLAYVAIYNAVGAVISPVVTPYYEDPSLGLGLVMPHWHVIVGMQVLRGFLYLLAILPVAILWEKSRLSLGKWLGLGIFAQVASLMLLSYWLPLELRATHFIELTTDSFAQAFAYAWLLSPTGASAKSRRGEAEGRYARERA